MPSKRSFLKQKYVRSHLIPIKRTFLKQKYVRSHLIPSKRSFLKAHDVRQAEITLREVARGESLETGQGFQSCTYVSDCSSNRCGCRLARRLRNSNVISLRHVKTTFRIIISLNFC